MPARSGHIVVTSSVINTQNFIFKIISHTLIIFLPYLLKICHHPTKLLKQEITSMEWRNRGVWRLCEKATRTLQLSQGKHGIRPSRSAHFLNLRFITIYMVVFLFVQNSICYVYMYLWVNYRFMLMLMYMYMYSIYSIGSQIFSFFVALCDPVSYVFSCLT